MQYHEQFDVIVVGGGHAGTEAATAAARMGLNTLLLTHNIDTLGHMSCNPAIGGIGKGHLVKEVDALGGIMARATDLAGIQFRTLNSSKGPAVRATRAQADRLLYKAVVRQTLENYPNLKIFQQACDDLVMDGDRVAGVVTQSGIRISGKTVARMKCSGGSRSARVCSRLCSRSLSRALTASSMSERALRASSSYSSRDSISVESGTREPIRWPASHGRAPPTALRPG